MDWTRAGPPTQRTIPLYLVRTGFCWWRVKWVGVDVRSQHLHPHACASFGHDGAVAKIEW